MDPPQEGTTMSIKDIERRLATAERQANAWGIDDTLRAKRLDEVAALEAELADALAANGELAGHGRRRR